MYTPLPGGSWLKPCFGFHFSPGFGSGGSNDASLIDGFERGFRLQPWFGISLLLRENHHQFFTAGWNLKQGSESTPFTCCCCYIANLWDLPVAQGGGLTCCVIVKVGASCWSCLISPSIMWWGTLLVGPPACFFEGTSSCVSLGLVVFNTPSLNLVVYFNNSFVWW